MKKNQIIFSTSAGHILEYFDSYLYGYFAFLLAPIFFPSHDPAASLISSFGAFAAGFIMRPLGGILFGHLGDRFGRKKAFLASVILITIPTFGIGCLPSYETIGIAAPVLLIVFRLLQGISLGGEYGGASIYIREHVKKTSAGYAGSLLAAIGFVGALMGTFVAAIFTMDSMPTWSWRVPFLMGGTFGIVIYFLRRKLVETPAFEEIEKKGKILKAPIVAVFRNHFKRVLSGVGIGMNTTIPYYLAIIYMNPQYKDKLGLSTAQIMAVSTSIMILWVIALPIAGYFSDKVGRKKLMAWSALSTIIAAYPMFYIMQEAQSFIPFLAGQLLISLSSIPYVATCSSVLPTLFPPAERYSGAAFSYSLGVAVFGGTAPLIVSWLVNEGVNVAPALYLIFAGLCGWIAIKFINPAESDPLEVMSIPPKELAAESNI